MLGVVVVVVVVLYIQHTERVEDRCGDLPSERDQCKGLHHVTDNNRSTLLHPS